MRKSRGLEKVAFDMQGRATREESTTAAQNRDHPFETRKKTKGEQKQLEAQQKKLYKEKETVNAASRARRRRNGTNRMGRGTSMSSPPRARQRQHNQRQHDHPFTPRNAGTGPEHIPDSSPLKNTKRCEERHTDDSSKWSSVWILGVPFHAQREKDKKCIT